MSSIARTELYYMRFCFYETGNRCQSGKGSLELYGYGVA